MAFREHSSSCSVPTPPYVTPVILLLYFTSSLLGPPLHHLSSPKTIDILLRRGGGVIFLLYLIAQRSPGGGLLSFPELPSRKRQTMETRGVEIWSPLIAVAHPVPALAGGGEVSPEDLSTLYAG